MRPKNYWKDGKLIYRDETGEGLPENIRAAQSQRQGLGDKIAFIATPIARALGSDCIDKETKQLKPESGCGKMKARLNAGMPITEAIKLRSQGK